MKNKPRIRFKGFAEDWEQRELSSLTEYIGTGKSRFAIKEFGEYAILGSTNVIGYDDAYDYDGNFILTARVGANAGQLYQYSGKVKITDNTVFLMSDRSQFIYYALTHFDLRRLSFGTGQPLVKSSELQKLKLCVPVSKSEQEKIGEIFNNIDNIITLHQRKLEKLKLAKKALLQKLFPKNGSKFPELRFNGFADAWEQRKFSDITYLSGIKNKENKPYESYSISNEFGFIPQDEQFENGGTMKTADKSMYYIVSQNSFAYNPARINVGSIGYYNKPDNVIVSSLYEVFKTTDIVSDKFLWHWFKSNQFNRLIEKYQEGGVRLYFYYDKLCKGTIDLPTINEQNKISNLLDDLDMYITLHQRKLDKLQEVKKGLLQKMFV